MKKRYLFIFFNLVFSFSLVAKDRIVDLDEKIDVQFDGFYIKEVLNVTGEEHYIGFKLSSATFSKEPLRFRESIENELSSVLVQRPKMEAIPITLRVNQLFHYQVMLEEDVLVATEISLSFIVVGEESYQELFRASTTKFYKRRIEKSIMSALEDCMEQFAYREILNKFANFSEPIEYLNYNPLDLIDKSDFLSVDRKQKGLFYNYHDFYFNTPDTTIEFDIKYRDRLNKHDSLLIFHATPIFRNENDKTKFWGFADGQHVFANINNKYIPLSKEVDGYYLLIRSYNSGAVISAGIVGGIFGGLIGAAILGATAGALSSGTGAKQLLKLDLISGSFNVFFEEENKKVCSKIVIYSPDKNSGNLEINIEDESAIVLKPNTWHELIYPSSQKKITVKITTQDNQSVKAEIVPRLFRTDAYVCYERKNKTPLFRKVTESNTESLLEDLTEETRIN